MYPPLPTGLATLFEGRFETAVQLAILAGDSTLTHFRSRNYQVERKSDRSPVTIADKNAELLILEQLKKRYPQDEMLGEEFGDSSLKNTSSAPESVSAGHAYRWIIDPIDGTKSFISGVPLYSTLVGVTFENQPLIGIIYIPALKELIIAAVGRGAWYLASPEATWQRARVSEQSSLGEGVFVVSQADNFHRHRAWEAYEELTRRSYITRTWGDGYGYLLVATGRAEVMVDPIVNPWDVAAVMPVINEAGGRFTDWSGEPNIFSGDGVGSNSLVHDEVLSVLRRSA